ncbi:MAG: Tyrosine-protein kinase Wzc (EC [uncultured Sulfurovum sp.]|uniref:non-specific protein-tyrosine kinase n=1 Tax=uncultured Sulfurovum sp. TaxID=269237 RepID=A0A6S6UCR2_9BACT|nr:MAG: Tyrosine-protein kinase Wzc (EC [uncultured Sulfurovum sp.]
MSKHQNKPSQEFTFHDIGNIFKQYKWSIIIITIIVSLLSYVYVYFKTPIYVSYSIIKVKATEKTNTGDVINNTIATTKSKDVLEEISLLKTFKINKQPLEKIGFKVRYFIEKEYKKIEIYEEELPFEINKVQILNEKIIGKMLTVLPMGNHYEIKYEPSYKEKIKQKIFQIPPFSFKEIKNLNYEEMIRHPYFRLKINKRYKFEEPIYIVLQGEKRDIFERSIRKSLNITQLQKDTSLIKISFEDTIPKRANLYVDALTKSFIDYSIKSKNTQNSKTLNFITEELENIKTELKESEQKLESHQISTNIVQPSVQASLYIRNLSDIDIEISENKLKTKLVLNLIDFVRNNYNLDAIAPSISKLEDQNTLTLITKLQDEQSLEEELTQEYTDEYPKLKIVRKQIDTLRNKIIYNLKSLRTNINYENENLAKRKQTYEKNMKTLPSKERELVNIKRNYEVKSKMYGYLLKKQAENKIIQLATFSDYQIIDDAYNTNIPVKPKKSLILATSILIGLLLGTILALIRYSRNAYIQNKNDLQNITELPFYGSIPYYKQKKYQVSVHNKVKSPFSEAFRTLRTNLQFMSQTDKGTVMLITSTIPGEGKSTTVANLATILEMTRYKTIIINFDLRKPTLHNFFDIGNEKGVSDFLGGYASLDEIISSTEFANLDIIPSGPIPTNPAELILSKNLQILFEELKERYEYIIIDTAPIGIISDTKILMQHSDLNLIIIREDYAKKEFIFTLEEMIAKHNFKNIGLILNASKAIGGEYGYGYSYEYK